MHRIPAQHRAVRRSNAQPNARNPSLINLPPPVDSIPVLGPISSPLGILANNGGNTPGQRPTASPNPSSSPNSLPTPTHPGGGGNNGGNGGNNGGNGRMPATPGPGPPAVLANGGGPAVPPSPVIPNTTPSVPTPGKSSPTDGNMSSVTGASIPNGNKQASGSGNTAVENVSPTNPASLGGSNPDILATTGFPAPSQSLLHSSGSHTAGATSPQSTGSGTGASSGKTLSGGAIAGIVILCLLIFLALILFIVRRRSIARRMELRKEWFGRSGSVGRLSFVNGAARRSHMDSDGEDRRSTRSSFGTTYDQGPAFGAADSPLWPSIDSVPDLPPMAQVHERNSVLMSTGGAAARRESLNRMLSNCSDSDAQYLICSVDHNISDPPSPMSVRPFSPSESFSFPKPPAPPTGNGDSFCIASLCSSTTTLANLAAPSRALTTPTSQHQALIPGLVVLPSIAAPKDHLINPFADPVKPDVTDVEVIRRSFEPSLEDELEVRLGDHVLVHRMFDDGWAFVEKLARTKGERYDQGLIPIDCLSNCGQTPPVFVAL